MALELSLMNSQDLEDWTIGDFSSTSPQSNALWSAQPSPKSIELLVEQGRRNLIDPTIRYLKVTNSDTGELIASAKWHLHLHPHNEPNADEACTASQRIPEERSAIMDDFLELVHRHRQACIGTRPHLALTNLSTRPAHRRNGAASIMIRWGLEVADEHGVETYTEAHEGSKTLYEKFGFKTVGEFELDLGRYGGEVVKHYYVRKLLSFSSDLALLI
jgi:GNAT superfamily N-acetyltransferase